jgi:hypothetical protein
LRALGALLWFFKHAVTVGGLGAAHFLIPFLALTATLVFDFVRDNKSMKRLLLPIILLPPL